MGHNLAKCGCLQKCAHEFSLTKDLNNIEPLEQSPPIASDINIISSPKQKKLKLFQGILPFSFRFSSPYLTPPELKIQSLYRGFIFRTKKFSLLKSQYEQDESKLIKSKQTEFISPQIRIWEKLFNEKLLSSSCKAFYQENDDSIEKCKTGDFLTKPKLFHSKGLIKKYDGYSSLYIGQVDINYDYYGEGVLYSSKGSKYEGTWVKGEFTGWGKYIDNKGNYYEGPFVLGELNGKGIKISSSGCVYIGEFKNSMKNGIGKEENEENVYEGEFREDKRNGKGELRFKNSKDVYEGDFFDGNIKGNGYYVWENRNSYKGEFVNGKMHGRGVYKWIDGSEYEGEYKDNIKEGNGVFKWADGRVFKGKFIDGRPDGKGKLSVQGIEFDATFRDGKLIGNLKEMYKKRKRELKEQNGIK